MTKRKPLEWYDTGTRMGIDGQVPACDKCWDLLFSPLFLEACSSVAIEHPTSAGELARRTVDSYHARRHPVEMSAAVGRAG